VSARQLAGGLIVGSLLIFVPASRPAETDLIQVHEDFSNDPGWEGRQNRIIAKDPPIVKQNFGWAATSHTGSRPGEIGGTIWQSRTPAWYALALGHPLSFKESFSFSGRIAFMPSGGAGAAYLGFFNHELQGWRVWNSMAIRLGGESGGHAAFGVDSMTAAWSAVGASEGYIHVPVDGKPHTFRFCFDPAAEPGDWPDPRLRKYLSTRRQTTEQILDKARQDEPALTVAQLKQRLEAAHAAGLIQYLQRTGHESIIGRTSWSGYFWFLKSEKEKGKGAMILQVDDGPPFKVFLSPGAQEQPVSMDRLGLFNLQMYHQYIELYVSDLAINGHKVDLSKDPGWERQGNQVEFAEQDFQRQDYGYSETNWAGKQIGEIGGVFTSAEPVDPLTGYYADAVGKLSLDDPLSFAGNVCFVHDSTDSGMQIGFFNSHDLTAPLTTARKLHTHANSLGILVEGGAAEGKRFSPAIASRKDTGAVGSGFPFQPTRERHAFRVDYDPKANQNMGRITVTFDDRTLMLDLTAEQRADGAVFDRFGVANLRSGGKFVEIYFDDLSYTARRPEDFRRIFHKQSFVQVPYPKGGREY